MPGQLLANRGPPVASGRWGGTGLVPVGRVTAVPGGSRRGTEVRGPPSSSIRHRAACLRPLTLHRRKRCKWPWLGLTKKDGMHAVWASALVVLKGCRLGLSFGMLAIRPGAHIEPRLCGTPRTKSLPLPPANLAQVLGTEVGAYLRSEALAAYRVVACARKSQQARHVQLARVALWNGSLHHNFVHIVRRVAGQIEQTHLWLPRQERGKREGREQVDNAGTRDRRFRRRSE